MRGVIEECAGHMCVCWHPPIPLHQKEIEAHLQRCETPPAWPSSRAGTRGTRRARTRRGSPAASTPAPNSGAPGSGARAMSRPQQQAPAPAAAPPRDVISARKSEAEQRRVSELEQGERERPGRAHAKAMGVGDRHAAAASSSSVQGSGAVLRPPFAGVVRSASFQTSATLRGRAPVQQQLQQQPAPARRLSDLPPERKGSEDEAVAVAVVPGALSRQPSIQQLILGRPPSLASFQAAPASAAAAYEDAPSASATTVTSAREQVFARKEAARRTEEKAARVAFSAADHRGLGDRRALVTREVGAGRRQLLPATREVRQRSPGQQRGRTAAVEAELRHCPGERRSGMQVRRIKGP